MGPTGKHAQGVALAVGVGWALAYPHVSAAQSIELIGYCLPMLICGLLAVSATLRIPRPRRLPWVFMTSGMGVLFLGDLHWAMRELNDREVWAGGSDLAYLVGTLLLGISAALLARTPTQVRDRFGWIDVLVLTVVLSAVGWIGLIYPYATQPGLVAVEQAWAFAYPMADLFLFGCLLRILVRGNRQTRAALLLAVGLLCKLVADGWYAWIPLNGGVYGDGALVDSWWLLASVLLVVAVLDPSTHDEPSSEPDDGLGAGRMVIILSALMTPLVLLVWDIHHTDGGTSHLTAGLSLLLSAVVCVLVALRFWSLRRRARALETLRSTERLSAVVHHSEDAVLLVSAEGVINYASPAIKQWGFDPVDVPGTHMRDWVPAEDRASITEQVLALTSAGSGAIHQFKGHLDDASGARRSVEGSLHNLLAHESLHSIVVTLRDVTRRRALEDQLRRRAFQDDLTGLANRDLFVDRLNHALHRSLRRQEVSVAVLFVDLDDFKAVNDGLGHDAGDELLRHVADRIRLCVRPGDTTARIGGDEFAILLEDLATLDQAAAVAQRILDVLALPVRVKASDVTVPASIGVAPRSPGATAESLLRDADIAMHGAKANGKRRVEIVDDRLRQAARRRLQLRCDLPSGLYSGGFRVVYQPVHRIDDHRATGFEALLRWQHPEHGAVSPVEFIPAAEASGFIVELGRWVLGQACARAAEWNMLSPEPLVMNVNVSGVQLMHPGFPEVVRDMLHDTGLSAHLLTLELTESVLVDARVGRVLGQLRDLGVGIAIDDFGTGYSSLAYVHNFPITTIKIDRQFIAPLDNADDPTLVRSVLQIAQGMGLKTVAEGVETQTQLDVLRALGCPMAQGFYFGRPVEPEALLPLVRGGLPMDAGTLTGFGEGTEMQWAGTHP